MGPYVAGYIGKTAIYYTITQYVILASCGVLMQPQMSTTSQGRDFFFPYLCNLVRGQQAYLDVVVRIPVRVVDDDRVCARQVDTEASGSCRQQEAELLGAGRCDGRPGSGEVTVTTTINTATMQSSGWTFVLIVGVGSSPLKRSMASCLRPPVIPPSMRSYL